jgi:hypothetical protein
MVFKGLDHCAWPSSPPSEGLLRASSDKHIGPVPVERNLRDVFADLPASHVVGNVHQAIKQEGSGWALECALIAYCTPRWGSLRRQTINA